MRISLLLLAIALFFSVGVDAQKLPKKEKKALKKEIKAYKKDPASYKKMLEDHDEEVKELEAEIEGLQGRIKGLENQLAAQADSIAALRMRLAEAVAAQKVDIRELPDGRAYQVQIGAYEVFSIKEFLEQDRYMSYEFEEGMEKYMLGYFQDLNFAEQFRDELVRMGIEDAFVVRYEDGARIGPEDTADE